jgi:hypothetical protein
MKATRGVVFGGAGLVGAAAATTSALSLYELAKACGIPEPYSAALPIALDAGAAVASLAWITETGAVRTWARAIAVAALVGTVAGNGVQHAITAGLLPVSLLLVLLVGASIPAMLFAVVHLAALLMKPATRSVGRKPTEAKPAAPKVPTQKTVETTPPPVVSERGHQRAAMVAWLEARDPVRATDELASLRAKFGCSETTAKRVRRAAGRVAS